MNLAWFAILAIASAFPGSTAAPRPVAPGPVALCAASVDRSSISISALPGEGDRPSPASAPAFEADVRDVDEDEPDWTLGLDGLGPASIGPRCWSRIGDDSPRSTRLDRLEHRPASFPLRC